MSIDDMRRVRCDQCQFGMTSVDGAGNVGPARKATGSGQMLSASRRPWTDSVVVDTITPGC